MARVRLNISSYGAEAKNGALHFVLTQCLGTLQLLIYEITDYNTHPRLHRVLAASPRCVSAGWTPLESVAAAGSR
jgi:hypothetical protein